MVIDRCGPVGRGKRGLDVNVPIQKWEMWDTYSSNNVELLNACPTGRAQA